MWGKRGPAGWPDLPFFKGLAGKSDRSVGPVSTSVGTQSGGNFTHCGEIAFVLKNSHVWQYRANSFDRQVFPLLPPLSLRFDKLRFHKRPPTDRPTSDKNAARVAFEQLAYTSCPSLPFAFAAFFSFFLFRIRGAGPLAFRIRPRGRPAGQSVRASVVVVCKQYNLWPQRDLVLHTDDRPRLRLLLFCSGWINSI